MNPDAGLKAHDRYRMLLTLLFLGLTVSFIFMVTAFWTFLLEPELSSRAKVTARAVMGAHIGPVSQALEDGAIKQPAALKEQYLGKLLLLSDPETGVPFITGIHISLDPDAVPSTSLSQDVILGNLTKNKPLLIDLPMYSHQNKELIALLQLSVNPAFIRVFEKRIRLTFFAGAGAGLILLLSAWTLTALIRKRLVITEKTLEEKKAQIIHAGRLTALGEMATGIAHELNQPLAIIRIAADGLLEWFTGQNTQAASMEKKAAKTISRQVERAGNIIDHMRVFARQGKKSSSIRSISLKDPIENAVSFFREQFRNHGITLDIDIQESMIVTADPYEIEQIVVNLLSNARYAVDNRETGDQSSEKTIRIRVYPDEKTKQSVLEVEDNGKGMDNKEKERCLEPFFTTKIVGEGTGLGLSIVHGIVKESGMEMEIDSIKGVGSTFRILIPHDI